MPRELRSTSQELSILPNGQMEMLLDFRFIDF
jgi:hypothetical protein